MKRLVPILAAAAALAGCDQAPQEPQVTVEDAVVTLPVIPGRPGAAYFTLRTNNDPTRLTGISSPMTGRIELHETVNENGVSRMVPLQNSTFDPDRPLTFESGGRHAMLFDIDPSVRAGERIPLTFTFDPAPPVTVEAEVRAFGGGHAGH
jgi:periplasmic copper chaperone A